MATEKDAGRDKRIVMSLIAAAVVVACGGTYVAWSYLHSPKDTPSRIDVSNVANSTNRHAQETPAYRNLLSEYNNEGAEQAQKDNQSFIASIPVGQGTTVNTPPPPDRRRPTQHKPQTHTQQTNTQQKGDGLTDMQRAALKKMMGQITGDTGQLQEVAAIGVSTEPGAEDGKGSNGNKTSAFSGWADSITVQNTAYNVTSSKDQPAIELIPAFTRAPGSITIGVDSDNSSTPVIGTIWSGPYRGASFKADRSQLAGDGVVIHFTSMYWNHKSYTVDAYALKDSTLMANVATNVNHRYWSRILLPAIASGIGKAGQLYQDANTDILTNGYSTVTSHASMPNSTAVTGVIAGGTAAQAADVLKQDAAKLPVTQATIDAGQPVYIQFMSSVTTADEVKAHGSSGTTTTTSSSTQSQLPRPTLAQLREQTRAQIQSQLPSSQTTPSE
ncbi:MULTISPECIES: conjugal transfer protein TraO [Rosenbergiella]|uniref:conjugal transfer protein TraO n=1 Tax=Rosenbergiella TaxID=1356488 RepID=UPI001F503284|nr:MULTISPECIES: conjugal transfer protein TraO [Rosenbergiella]